MERGQLGATCHVCYSNLLAGCNSKIYTSVRTSSFVTEQSRNPAMMNVREQKLGYPCFLPGLIILIFFFSVKTSMQGISSNGFANSSSRSSPTPSDCIVIRALMQGRSWRIVTSESFTNKC
jgi:hypothetical protein